MRPFLTLHEPYISKTYRNQGLWTDDTFYSLLASHATKRPNAPALRDGHRYLTWAEILTWVDGVAEGLESK